MAPLAKYWGQDRRPCVQRKAQLAKWILVVGLYSSGAAEERRWRADSRGLMWRARYRMAWMYSGFCVWELPVCSRFVDEQEASKAVPGAAEPLIVWALGERDACCCALYALQFLDAAAVWHTGRGSKQHNECYRSPIRMLYILVRWMRRRKF